MATSPQKCKSCLSGRLVQWKKCHDFTLVQTALRSVIFDRLTVHSPISRMRSPGRFHLHPSSCWCSIYCSRRSWNTTRTMLCGQMRSSERRTETSGGGSSHTAKQLDCWATCQRLPPHWNILRQVKEEQKTPMSACDAAPTKTLESGLPHATQLRIIKKRLLMFTCTNV